MHTRNPRARRSPSACRLLLVSALMLVHTDVAAPAEDADIALECRFSSGLQAIYLVNRARATVRRVDLLQSRHGWLRSTAAEYRFDFRDFSSGYRIEVILDRGTGNTRRVLGTRDNMDRVPDATGGVPGLVYDTGQCHELGGSPGAKIGQRGRDRGPVQWRSAIPGTDHS